MWVPALGDRAGLELPLRRMHLIRLRTSAKNRIFGLLTQWGVRCSVREVIREVRRAEDQRAVSEREH